MDFFVRYKKMLLALLRIALVVLVLSFLALGVLLLSGLVHIENGIKVNISLLEGIKNTWCGVFLIIGIQVLVTTTLCFLPGTTMTFLVLLPLLYEKLWQAFLIAFAATVLSSLAMYFVGRFGGRRLCEKILGKEDCDKAAALLCKRGTVYFPLMMLFPAFPDDALVMAAGTLGMRLSWFVPSILLGRGIGIASIIFGFGSIPYERFTAPWHWILFVLAIGICVVSLFGLANRLNRFLSQKK